MRAEQMISKHPDVRGDISQPLARCIDDCFECAQACISCADQCRRCENSCKEAMQDVHGERH